MSYYQKRIDEGSVLEDYCVSDDQMLGNLCRSVVQRVCPHFELWLDKHSDIVCLY